MKKVFAFCLTVVMMITMSLTAFAAPDSFVSSPSANPLPRLISFFNENPDCDAELIVTPYSARNNLKDEIKAKLEDAYRIILNTADLTSLNSDLEKIASDKGMLPSNLAVSDLFDISYNSCGTHNEHGKFTIKLEAESLKSFVGLICLSGDNWVFIEDAKVDADGYLTFTTDRFGPYAIVVNTGVPVTDSPQTGDPTNMTPYILLMAASAIVVVVLLKKSKKHAA